MEAIFRCESIPQLLQTFERSGTKSRTLESMMRSIQGDKLDSGFELQILQKLDEKPWRINTISDLDAEFQIIKNQYKAKIILEEEARRRFACELAKYLHRDYLLNFDEQAIFSPQSEPYAFYTYIRENDLWQNLLTENLSPAETETEQMPPPIAGPRDNEQILKPEKTKGVTLLDFFYWTFLIFGAWLLLSIVLGLLTENRRFTNPTTQQIMEVLLMPYRGLLRLWNSPQLREGFGGTQKPNTGRYGTPVSEEELQNLTKEQIQARQKAEQPPRTSPEATPETPAPQKVQQLEQKLAELTSRMGQLSTKTDTPASGTPDEITELREDLQRTQVQLDKIGLRLEKLDQKLTGLDQQILSKAAVIEIVQAHTGGGTTRQEETPPTPPPDTPSGKVKPGLQIDLDPQAESTTEVPDDTLELTPIPGKQQQIWYASSPQKGLFYGRRLEDKFMPRQTVYKITVDAYDPNRATFTLVEDEDTIRLALNIPDSYIAPAMDLKGEGKVSESRDIGPIEAGLLEKEGENWKIVKKGVLHYR